jgi:hypothetical protein
VRPSGEAHRGPAGRRDDSRTADGRIEVSAAVRQAMDPYGSSSVRLDLPAVLGTPAGAVPGHLRPTNRYRSAVTPMARP